MEILLFGITKDIVGSSSLTVSATEELATVTALKGYLFEKYPELEQLSSLNIAVNEVIAVEQLPLKASDTIALIPPVSGG